MTYNYNFEVAAAVLMLLLIAIMLIHRDVDLAKGRAFFAFVISSVIESITNVLSAWGLEHTEVVSGVANWWICLIFFMSEALTSILYFRYVVNLCEPSRQRRIIYARITFIPFLAFVAMILTSWKFNLIFDVKDNVYSQGSAAWYGYFYITLFLACSLFVAILSKQNIRGRNRYAIILGSLISIIAIIVQYKYKTLILTGFANAIVIYIFYIVIQNPNEYRDRISNVNNERAFHLFFENEVNLEHRMQILTVDIHQPNQVYSLFGYRNGNVILGEVGDFLSSVTDPKRVFRISPRVFALVLDGDTDVENIRQIILKRFASSWNLDNLEVVVSVNMTKIIYPDDVGDISEFFGMNNFAKMLLRRNAAYNYIEMNSELKEKFLRVSKVDEALDRALGNASLEVYFQPIYDLKKRKFTSAEALARLIDPELGFISPEEFIDAAETNGTIIPLDLMVLDKTCNFIEKEILTRKNTIDIETVQINISAAQFMQPSMDEMILSIVDKHEVPHDMIVIEVTERAKNSAAERMERHMKNLKDKGIGFALDDYGTGNSNCSYLIDYPFDKVKFDKNMVWAYFKTDTGRIILDGEMQTIHNLNIPIVAEGIEEIGQLETMARLGVELIQGYYFSKPLPGKDFIPFLENYVD